VRRIAGTAGDDSPAATTRGRAACSMIAPMVKRRAKRHPGTLRLRGKSYWLTLCVGRQRHYFTIPTTDRAVAEQFAVDRAKELRREQDRLRSGLPGTVRCSALFDVFERNELPARAKGTQDAYRDSLGPLRTYFVDTLGDPTIDRIRATHIAEFLAWRRVNRTDGTAPLAGRTGEVSRSRSGSHGPLGYSGDVGLFPSGARAPQSAG